MKIYQATVDCISVGPGHHGLEIILNTQEPHLKKKLKKSKIFCEIVPDWSLGQKDKLMRMTSM